MFSHVTVISSGNRNGFYLTALCEDLNEFDWFVPEKLVFVSAAFVLGIQKEGVGFVSWLKGVSLPWRIAKITALSWTSSKE